MWQGPSQGRTESLAWSDIGYAVSLTGIQKSLNILDKVMHTVAFIVCARDISPNPCNLKSDQVFCTSVR